MLTLLTRTVLAGFTAAFIGWLLSAACPPAMLVVGEAPTLEWELAREQPPAGLLSQLHQSLLAAAPRLRDLDHPVTSAEDTRDYPRGLAVPAGRQPVGSVAVGRIHCWKRLTWVEPS